MNVQGCLVKSLKIQSALKSNGKSLKGLEKPLNLIVDRYLNQYKIVVPLFGAANAAPNKGTAILYLFSNAKMIIISV